MEFPAGIFPLCDSLPQGIVGARWHRVSTMRQPARPHPPTISTSYHPLRDMSLTKLLIFVPPRFGTRYQIQLPRCPDECRLDADKYGFQRGISRADATSTRSETSSTLVASKLSIPQLISDYERARRRGFLEPLVSAGVSQPNTMS